MHYFELFVHFCPNGVFTEGPSEEAAVKIDLFLYASFVSITALVQVTCSLCHRHKADQELFFISCISQIKALKRSNLVALAHLGTKLQNVETLIHGRNPGTDVSDTNPQLTQGKQKR